ncbi:MAG: hypothetical protein Q8R29_01105 [bacterium]|nr:hypothetical protein [bacterium]
MKKRFLSSHFSFFLALVIGLALAVGASVWATTIGTNISGTGTLDITGATTLNGAVTIGDAAADAFTINSNSVTFANAGTSTIPSASAVSWAIATSSADMPFFRFDTSNTKIGIASGTPIVTFSVGGAGNIYAAGGLGVGQATTTAGVIENTGNVLFGDAAGDIVRLNSASLIFNNAGTTTIPAASGPSWAIATSSANIPLVRYDTSNSRIGIASGTPITTLSIGGAGNVYAAGGLGVGQATTTAGVIETSSGPSLFGGDAFVVGSSGTTTMRVESTANGRGGCIQIESPGALAGAGSYFHMYATTTGAAYWQTGACK